MGEPLSTVVLEGSQDFVQWTVLNAAEVTANGQFQTGDAFAPGLTHWFYRVALP